MGSRRSKGGRPAGSKSSTRGHSPQSRRKINFGIPLSSLVQSVEPAYSQHILYSRVMATVHPSRLGLVPGSLSATKPPLSASREEELRQKLSARRHEEVSEERRGDSYRSSQRGRAPVNDKRESHAESGSREERTHDDTSHRTRGYEKSSYHDDRRNEEGRNNGRDLRDNRSSRSPSRRDYDSKTHSYPRDKSPQADGHRRPSPTYRPYESLPPPQDSPGHHVGPRTHRSEGAGVDVKKEKSDIRRGFEAAPPPPWRDGGSSGWQDGPPRGGYGGPLDFEKCVSDTGARYMRLIPADDALSARRFRFQSGLLRQNSHFATKSKSILAPKSNAFSVSSRPIGRL